MLLRFALQRCVYAVFRDIQELVRLDLLVIFAPRIPWDPLARSETKLRVRRGKRAEDNSAFVCLSASVERKARSPFLPSHLPLRNSREFCV